LLLGQGAAFAAVNGTLAKIIDTMWFLRIIIFFGFLMGETNGFAQIITNDIDNFWTTFLKLKEFKTKDDSIKCIDNILFLNASIGFKEFIKKYKFTPEDYYFAINQYPKFFNSIKPNSLITKSIGQEYLQFIDELKIYYPHYKPPKVYFVISPLKCGGTQIDSSIIIGAEIITSTKKIDLSEFKENFLGRIIAFDTNVKEHLIYIIAHETVHYLQKNADFDNYELLNKSLIEGSADFIAKLFTGVTANHILYDYGFIHEKDLWTEFIKDYKTGANTDNWMYNYDRIENEIPADLGYFIGFRIAEAYYKNSVDKKQAVFDIIEMSNQKEFYEKSKYNGNQ